MHQYFPTGSLEFITQGLSMVGSNNNSAPEWIFRTISTAAAVVSWRAGDNRLVCAAV